MPLSCAKCSRTNPSDAQYCYYDGVALSGVPAAAPPVSIGQKAFSAPFTLPNGKQCQNFDQLAIGCQENWSGAVDLLKQGHLEKFMTSQGRPDLAMAAREAARYPDKDRGLDQFLAKLPTQAVQPPKLTVEPMDLNLGQIALGASKSVPLKMRNQGMRLIYGSITVENAPWLTLGSGAGTNQKLFQFGAEMSVPVTIQSKRLRASNKPLEGKLIVDSNAGMFTIPVRAEVPVKPFTAGCLAGARSPRQIAEKAKANAKDAAPLFENGSVATWYKENGWTYPVKGVSASGLGAVQQFFEALGLTPPPKVELNEKAVNFKGQPGEQLRHSLEVKAQEKRPVYAHASADQPWLEVGRAKLNGRVATIPLTVSNVPAREGETLKAKVTITANGNQRFVIPVTLTIGGAFNLLAPIPLGGGGPGGGGAPVILNTRAGRKPAGGFNPLPLILLLLCLIGVLIWDLIPAGAGNQTPDWTNEPDPGIVTAPAAERIQPYDNEDRISVQFTEDSQRFGIGILKLRDPRYPEKPKLLTRYERGVSNNTVVRIEGHDYVYGVETAGVGIKWKGKKEVKAKDNGRKISSTMRYDIERIEVTQIVEIVIGEQTRLYDTALVKYQIHNTDSKIHTVGMRAMIDTYIGLNDGTPFFIPPTEDTPQSQLVDTKIELEKAKIPAFMRVMENSDINDRNTTVAELGLKIKGTKREPIEEINKVVVCRWPQEDGGNHARWDWPYTAMNEPAGREKDSCVVLYWSKINMNPGEKRTLAYTYGLGRIAGENETETEIQASKGKIRLLLGRDRIKKDRPFVATAYVKNADGQKCTLELPAGLRFAKGESPKKDVKTEPGKDYAVISWMVVADTLGDYKLTAKLDEGAESSAKAVVGPDSIFD